MLVLQPQFRPCRAPGDGLAILGDVGSWQLHNNASTAHSLPRLKVAIVDVGWRGDMAILADGFQMLAQTGGTLAQPQPLGRCPDQSAAYRIYDDRAAYRFYNYLLVNTGEQYQLLGVARCYRFCCWFEWHDGVVEVWVDGAGFKLEPGTSVALEPLVVIQGGHWQQVLQQLAQHCVQYHPPRPLAQQADTLSWCSWYAYYEAISAARVLDNVAAMDHLPLSIERVLIDDGYQRAMGDWLTLASGFEQTMPAFCQRLRKQGKAVGIWLAPFIAEAESDLVKEHPDWLVKDEQGAPLRADQITYGGWRAAPWYLLDVTHPQAAAYLQHVVSTMVQQWRVDLIKLDALYWGILPGRRYDESCSALMAYRRGLQLIADSAGEQCRLIGCNAPLWPSLGLVDLMRIGDDVERSAHRFSQLHRQLAGRGWQQGLLWQTDPDCLTLVDIPGQHAAPEHYLLHLTSWLVNGGVVMSGDPIAAMDAQSIAMLQRFLRLKEQLACAVVPWFYRDLSATLAECQTSDNRRWLALFNPGSQSMSVTLNNTGLIAVEDAWLQLPLRYGTESLTLALPPMSARLLSILEFEGDSQVTITETGNGTGGK